MKTISLGFEFRANDAPMLRRLRLFSELVKMRRDSLAFEAQLQEVQRIANASREHMEKWDREAKEVGE